MTSLSSNQADAIIASGETKSQDDSTLVSPSNKNFLLEVLENGVVPTLPAGCTHHFFISKHEKYKKDAMLLCVWLKEMGFRVWESNIEQEHGHGVTPEDMQIGVRNAAVVVLLLSPGIFHKERKFVYNTEIKYALEECHKPLMVLKINGFSSEKCKNPFNDEHDKLKHHVECCDGTDPTFQPWARAILEVPTRVSLDNKIDSKKRIMIEFRKIYDREYIEDPKFREEIDIQIELHSKHGSCSGNPTIPMQDVDSPITSITEAQLSDPDSDNALPCGDY